MRTDVQRRPRRRRARRLAAAALVAVACGGPVTGGAPAAGPDAAAPEAEAEAAWERVLARFVHRGGVDYAALAADRADLDLYLEYLAGVSPRGLSEAELIALWCNAYNAVVLDFVLDHYPGIGSVREVDGFFDERTAPVAGEVLTLDEIETRARDLGDARVHFAVVCASTSCPDLRAGPYDAERLDAQLEEQTRLFLAQPDKGLRWEPDDGTVWLSSIFKWYAGDFTGGSTAVAFFARGRVLEWVLPHLPPELAAELAERDPSVRYLDYDWGLNDRPGAASR